MPDAETHMIVRGLPARLKGKIARRVHRDESNLNDVCVQILADHFHVPFEPSGRKSSGEIGPYPHIVLDVPLDLKRRIDAEAAHRDDSIRNVVVEILASEFGEQFQPTGRWPARRAVA
jgi:hypothetical protein